MKPVTSIALALCVLAAASPAGAWGPIGHRVSAELAERNIDGKTRAQIEMILGDATIADASTLPDEERSNPGHFWQEEANPYHYVTLPPGTPVEGLVHPEEGDALTALQQFTATLRNPDASREDKAVALWFVVHIVSDLHQPLHVGNGQDRGGNWFNVTWYDEPQNLHWVWDEGMILQRQRSSTEYAEALARWTTPQQIVEWWDADPATWIAESADLRERIYPETGGDLGDGSQENPVYLKYDYQWQWRLEVDHRLMQSGVRLAAYLDWVFAGE